MSDYLPKNAKFSLGQIVYHSKFKYRGVIVDADPNFQGTDEWYDSGLQHEPEPEEEYIPVQVEPLFGYVEKERKKLGKKARNFVIEQYSITKMA